MTDTFGRPRNRRIIVVLLVIACALLALFPQRYRSAVTLAPSDPAMLGLSGPLSQLGAANSVFGNQAAVEVTIRVGASVLVRNQVIDKLGLMKRLNFSNRIEASRWLGREIEVRSLRGGVVQMETRQSDPAFAEELIAAYAEAVRQRLAVINRQQTAYKRQILEELMQEADDRLDKAQANYDNYRRQTRYSDPTFAIAAIGDRIPVLQAAIRAKEVQLSAARTFATEDNMSVRQLVAELSSLKGQLAEQQALDPRSANSVGRVVEESTKGKKLERQLTLALQLRESYNRYLLGTAVEDLTSQATLRIIEPPFIDTQRQISYAFVALALLFVLLGTAIEFYQLRPPLEARRPA